MSIKTEIDLYNYQKGAIDKIFERFEDCPSDYHLLYQLPTGGGKTIIFSEIVRQYLKLKKKKLSEKGKVLFLSKKNSQFF